MTEAEALALATEEEKKDPEAIKHVQKIYLMSTSAKIITALRGTREERSILVRDPNRLVSTAVLGSPKLSDAEVESFSNMKSLSAEVLRLIGSNKDWTKRYQVTVNLVKNPRTPLNLSLGMVPRLNPRDMKAVAVDRNVPEVIRKQAQKFIKDKA
jgi:hypothetical protein